MSLPSQSSRNTSRSSSVYYRRSRNSPIKRAAILVVIVAAVFALWYFLIRPKAANPADPADNPIANNDTGVPAGNTGNLDEPTRPLPGASTGSNPTEDVSKILGSDNDTNEQPVEISNRTPSTQTNTDILDAATSQAEEPVERPQSRPQTQPQTQPRTALTGVQIQLDTARRLVSENKRVEARALLSRTLINANLTAAERQLLRDELTVINNRLVFSPTADPRDPMTEEYKVASGDSLSRIAARRELATHWKLIARVNQISDPSRIRLGQSIKLVRGPFHAIVDKSDHRIDIFHGSPADPSSWLYIRSFDVGLGADDGTPIGEFVVSANKLENPGWVNPRDAREQYEPNDPANPIGEFWIGLTGQGDSANFTSYGIHGTIDPDSIGGDESMGCVRLADGDIDIVYELLAEHISRVMIVP